MTSPDLKAILLTDLVDSTGTTERAGEHAAARLWAAHDRSARDLLGRWRGRELDKSDGFLLLFDEVRDAAGFALDDHRAIGALPQKLEARVGIHRAPIAWRTNTAGDVALGAPPVEVENWLDKALTARLMNLAPPPCRTLLSPSAAAALIGGPAAVTPVGHWQLQGFAEPVLLHELHEPGAVSTPLPDVAKAHAVVRRGERWVPRREIPSTAPAERDAFLGPIDVILEGGRPGVRTGCREASRSTPKLLTSPPMPLPDRMAGPDPHDADRALRAQRPRRRCGPLAIAIPALCSALIASIAPARAAPPETDAPGLTHCAAIAAAADRLACYDGLAGRAPPSSEPVAARPLNPDAAPPAGSRVEPKDAPPADTAAGTPGSSLLSRYWELTPADRRGTFEVVNFQPNYILPLHVTNRINRAPASPTEAVSPQPSYRQVEAKFQFSIRTKVAQDVPRLGGDLWLAFTQQSFWQVYDASDSRPFRNTDYQPEAIYVRPIPQTLGEALPFGWRWRYALLALAHESNGQSDPLSRSWNRAYLGLGADRGDWAMTLRFNERLFSRPETDNNPDLVRRRGRGELQLLWAHGLHTALLEVRSSLRNTHDGGVRVEYTYPIFRDQPNGLRWIVQAFSGYGETLTDYNFRQTSLGAGVSFLQF